MTTPFYVIAAKPSTDTRLKGFFREGSSSPGWILTDPERFRYAGFDVSTGSVATLVDGDRWEVESGDRKRLRLYQDGTLIFRMRADSHFLGWGQDVGGFAQSPWLNPVAVVESHTSFVHLYKRIVESLLETPPQIVVTGQVSHANIDGRRIALTRYYSGGIFSVFNPETFPVHDPNAKYRLSIPTTEVLEAPDRPAFQLIEKFYSLFDAPGDIIPFSADAPEGKSIDIEALKRL